MAVRRIRRGIDRGERRIVFPFWLALGTRLADLLPAWLGDIILRDPDVDSMAMFIGGGGTALFASLLTR